MAGPIENIAARGLTKPSGVEGAANQPAGKTDGKFDQARQDALAGAEKAQELSPAASKQIEHDLRKRIEAAKTTNPAKLYGGDLGEARKRIDGLSKRVESMKSPSEASPLRDRLAQIEAQFAASEKRMAAIPETDNLRDLLAMQNEMYKLGQNIEILSKVVDAATSGIKSTLQMQV
jgi:hypothetical protein